MFFDLETAKKSERKDRCRKEQTGNRARPSESIRPCGRRKDRLGKKGKPHRDPRVQRAKNPLRRLSEKIGLKGYLPIPAKRHQLKMHRKPRPSKRPRAQKHRDRGVACLRCHPHAAGDLKKAEDRRHSRSR